MFFRIGNLRKISNDSFVAILAGGSKQGIQDGSTGPVVGVYSKEEDRSNLELGFASVLSTTSNTASVSIKSTDKTGSKSLTIRKGDYVKLYIKIDKLPYHSIFFDLALLDIYFNNLNNQPLYSFNDLLLYDNKHLEDSLLIASSKDVFETYDFLKTDTGFKQLNTPLSEGRYAGRSVFDVMRDCSKRDIYTYLNFVKGYPGKYTGNTWKMNETFATWVMNNAPYNKNEIYDSVMAYSKTPALLKKFIAKNRSLMIKDEFVRDWISDAIDANDQNDTIRSNKLLAAAKMALQYLDDVCSNAFYFYAKAQIDQDKKRYKEAVGSCDSAASNFYKCKNYNFYAECYFKKAYCLRMINKQDEAMKVYDKSNAILNDAAITLSDANRNNLTAKYYRETGNVWENKGEYKKAIEAYTQSINTFTKINTFQSLNSAASLQVLLANIYQKQGEYAKASQIYNTQLTNYTKLNDRKKQAEVFNNLGVIQFKLGNFRQAIYYHQQAEIIQASFNDYNNLGFSESQIGQSLWSIGNYDSAIAAHQKAIEYRRLGKSYYGQAYSWRKIGSLYTLSGDKVKALAAYDSTAYYYALAKDTINLVDNLLDIGDVYKTDKQYQKAFDYYAKAHNINVVRGKKPDIVDSYYKMADAAYSFDTAISRKYFAACYVMAKEIGDKTNQLYASLNLGLLAYRNYDYPSGQTFFTQSLQLAVAEKNKTQEAFCYTQIGNAYSNSLDFNKSLSYYNKAIRIYDSLGERSRLPSLYQSIAYNYSSKGEFSTAVEWYQKAQDTAIAIGNKADVGSALSSLSFLYLLQGDVKRAVSSADSSLNVFVSLNNDWQIANSYIVLGNVYNQVNDYEKAVWYYQSADTIFAKEKDDWSRSVCQNNIGNVYFFQADYDKALQYFFVSEKLLPAKLTTESHILAKLNIGETYYHKKDYSNAEKYLLEGYSKAKQKNAGRMLNSANLLLGKLYYDKSKYTESEQYLLQAYNTSVKMNEVDKIVETGLYLGRLYGAQHNLAQQKNYFRKSIEYASQMQSSKYYWELLYETGLSFYNNNQYDSAITYLKPAVEQVEKAAQKLFGGAEAKKIYNADYKKTDLYSKLIACLAKTGKKEEAMFYVGKSNSQAIKEQMEKSGLTTTDKTKSDAIQKGTELMQKQTAIEQAIAKEKAKPEKEQNQQLIGSLESIRKVSEENYQNYLTSLVKTYPDLQLYFSKMNPDEFRNYTEFIPDSTIAVLYVINDNQLLIFTATNKEAAIRIVELKQDINKQAARFLSIIRNPNNATGTGAVTVRSTIKRAEDDVRGDFKTEAGILYNLLITPIADQLKDKKTICVIPNGKLSSIPFQALGSTDDNKQFHFLVEDYAVFYTNKMDVFMKPFKPQNIQTSFAALGNPDKSLPGASTEVKNIAKIIPSAAVFLEGEATEGKAKESLKKYSYVHFATHGILDYADFSQSYLLFAADDGPNDDGKLTIEEINGLTLKGNDLVMLSACETGVSKEEVKGWYISPANAFLNNKVKTVIPSLWKVPDEATELLQSTFYQNLQTMSRTEALRHAQATVSSNPKYAHPFYWSAFVLYGEWR